MAPPCTVWCGFCNLNLGQNSDDLHHICWVDNSATRQIACKLGAGKLKHVSGKLLWCQIKVAHGELEVRQFGTVRRLADIGTKPFSRSRFELVL